MQSHAKCKALDIVGDLPETTKSRSKIACYIGVRDALASRHNSV